MYVQVPEAKHITWTTTSWRACPYNCSPSDSYLQVTCKAKVRDLPPLLSVCVASHQLCTAVPTKKSKPAPNLPSTSGTQTRG